MTTYTNILIFNELDNFYDINENNNELTNDISKNIQALCFPNTIDVEEFLLVPEENIIYEVLEDDKIITELVNIFKNSDENN
ncbi:2584_t:CDS:1, partial [Diversispora eburnea]